MKIHLRLLELTCKRSREQIYFTDLTYFHGQIGSGKSTIARLIDFCLGGGLVDTPAVQNEFISATLYLTVSDVSMELSRDRGSNQIACTWETPEGVLDVVVPARYGTEEVIAGTGITCLSDFILHVAGIEPPRVRRSRDREDSTLKRLSFRNMFWYCYLDQDHIDNDIFYLGNDAEHNRRLDSRNVLRFIVGVHQEEVAGLEVELDEVRKERERLMDAANVLEFTLAEAGFSDSIALQHRTEILKTKSEAIQAELNAFKTSEDKHRPHAVEELRSRGRTLAQEIAGMANAISELQETQEADHLHLHEIQNLSTKVQRVSAARAVLRGVSFLRCPRCTQPLPTRPSSLCVVCGQREPEPIDVQDEVSETRADLSDREAELGEVIEAQRVQLIRLRRVEVEFRQAKAEVDSRLDNAMREYDSAYLSSLLEHERNLAEIHQERRYIEKLAVLPEQVSSLREKSDSLAATEARIRSLLTEARVRAEGDLNNLDLLGDLFLDCLVRSEIPGIFPQDHVEIVSPNFLPKVVGRSGHLATTSFDDMGSGGKKTLFKCCFALAVHRLASRIGGMLPSLLIIDSPMKNISERENRTQFEAFHKLIYDLSEDELRNTQFVFIDKEIFPPSDEYSRNFLDRHMTVDDDDAPPLISYYRESRDTLGHSTGSPVVDIVDVMNEGIEEDTALAEPSIPEEDEEIEEDPGRNTHRHGQEDWD